MKYKFKAGQKVRILDVKSLSDRSAAWAGRELTLATQDTWDEPAWSVEEPDCYYRFRESEMVLAGPVRTETARRLEPGVYGRLYVRGEGEYPFGEEKQAEVGFVTRGETREGGCFAGYVLTAPELRELARVALEIAGYLEDA